MLRMQVQKNGSVKLPANSSPLAQVAAQRKAALKARLGPGRHTACPAQARGSVQVKSSGQLIWPSI